jgi:hypothetical protein
MDFRGNALSEIKLDLVAAPAVNNEEPWMLPPACEKASMALFGVTQ